MPVLQLLRALRMLRSVLAMAIGRCAVRGPHVCEALAAVDAVVADQSWVLRRTSAAVAEVWKAP